MRRDHVRDDPKVNLEVFFVPDLDLLAGAGRAEEAIAVPHCFTSRDEVVQEIIEDDPGIRWDAFMGLCLCAEIAIESVSGVLVPDVVGIEESSLAVTHDVQMSGSPNVYIVCGIP